MLKKKDLASIVQNTQGFKNPKINLEQYCIDAGSVVDFAYFAGVEHDDIQNQFIFDLGAGTGRISIAAAFLGAQFVHSIDLDWDALLILKENIHHVNLCNIISPICADIATFPLYRKKKIKSTDITTLMNPPFGVQKRNADRVFLKTAFSFSKVVYSIHLTGEKTRKFISNFADKLGWTVDYIVPFNMLLERAYSFHKERVKKIDVMIYRFIKKRKR
ncbi:MAG: methyltransferase [Candidatus Lokiarchaeota archaeon]|nr:methyltransferase [Candidatus Lokiarchaeota archaeon]